MADAPSQAETERLETLRALLESASLLLGEITADPLFTRMARVFSQFPPADRDPILAILEREAQARLTAEAAGDLTGLTLHPNPSARLYTRVVTEEPRPNPERALASTLRAIRVTHRAVSPMNTEWKTIARAALEAIRPAERQSMARFAREVVTLVDECERHAPSAAAR
jgi:hypothetical protein